MTNETKPRRVAVVGLGLMGTPIATRLQAAGHDLAVWNRTAGRDAILIAAGARRAASPAEAARGAEVVFVMVTDDAAVKAVVADVLAGAADGTVIVDMSTVLP